MILPVLAAAGAAVLFAVLMLLVGKRKRLEINGWSQETAGRGQARRKTVQRLLYGADASRYQKTRTFLSEMGADYMMKREIDPVEYVLARIFLGAVFGLLGAASGGTVAAAALLAAGYGLIPDHQNRSRRIFYRRPARMLSGRRTPKAESSPAGTECRYHCQQRYRGSNPCI